MECHFAVVVVVHMVCVLLVACFAFYLSRIDSRFRPNQLQAHRQFASQLHLHRIYHANAHHLFTYNSLKIKKNTKNTIKTILDYLSIGAWFHFRVSSFSIAVCCYCCCCAIFNGFNCTPLLVFIFVFDDTAISWNMNYQPCSL